MARGVTGNFCHGRILSLSHGRVAQSETDVASHKRECADPLPVVVGVVAATRV